MPLSLILSMHGSSRGACYPALPPTYDMPWYACPVMLRTSYQTMLRQQQAGLCLLAGIVALLHVHVLAGQDMLGTQIMVLVRQRPILRQYLLCAQGLRNHRHSPDCCL